jgi:hypothetical protein
MNQASVLIKSIAASVVLFALLSGVSFAEQFTVLDETYTHDSWHENWRDASKWPDNWKSPINYAGGNAYFRVHVTSFKKEAKWMCQPCFFWDGGGEENHACYTRGKGSWTFSKPEPPRYVMMQTPTMWRYDRVNWSNVNRFMLIDNAGTKGAPEPTLRFELIMVAKGDEFVAPDHWVEPEDWGACYAGCSEKDAATSISTTAGKHPAQLARHAQLSVLKQANGNAHMYSIRGTRIKGKTIAHGVYITRTIK